jgi:hypothetical protein
MGKGTTTPKMRRRQARLKKKVRHIRKAEETAKARRG